MFAALFRHAFYTRNTVYIFYTLAGARHSWLADPSIEVQGLLRHELHYLEQNG